MGRSVNLLVFVLRCDDEAQAGLQGAGETPAARGEAPGAWRVEIGGGETTGRDAANSSRLGAASGGRRQGSPQARRLGTAAPIGCRAGARVGEDHPGRRLGGRFPDGALDSAAHRQSDRTTLRRRIQRRPLMAFATAAGLLVPEAGEARHPAQRGRDCPLEAAHLARAQKKRSEEVAPLSSSTNPD